VPVIELRRNKKVFGTIEINADLLIGKTVVFLIMDRCGWEEIKLPIGCLCTEYDGVTYKVTRYLDVTRKSKRQIKLLLDSYGNP
jgi:hypothetical protein